MGVGIAQQIQAIDGSHVADYVPHGNTHIGLTPGVRTKGAIPSKRMRLLHFENTFGDVYTSEYCLDAMISLVLIMTRSARPDADRLERLTGTAVAARPA